MDYKTTDFDAATEQTCLEQTAELPLEADFSVADYLGEIKKILKCRAMPFITSKQISGNAVMIDGTVIISVIYEDSDSLLCTAEYEIPFKKSFEGSNALDGGSCEAKTAAVINSCRAVTERKLSVKGSLKLDVNVISIEKRTVIADIDCDCFETLRGETEATTPMGIAEKSTVIDEELELPENMPAIRRIIRTSLSTNINDCKVLTGKVMASGDLQLCILYCDGDGSVQKLNTKFPFSQIIDMANLTEDCKCEITSEVCSLNLTTRTDSDGECRSVAVVSRILLICRAVCSQNVPVIFDAYSTRFKTDFSKEDVTFNKIVKQSNETFLCKKKIAFPQDSVRSISDMWCELSSSATRQDNNGIIIYGNILCSAICHDNDGGYTYNERLIDFEYPITVDAGLYKPSCRPQIKIQNCDYNYTSGDEAEISIELMINACICDSVTISLISSMNVDETAPATADDASLIAYFADKGENIWQISKKYLANRKELLELNDIHEDTVPISKMLLIPRM